MSKFSSLTTAFKHNWCQKLVAVVLVACASWRRHESRDRQRELEELKLCRTKYLLWNFCSIGNTLLSTSPPTIVGPYTSHPTRRNVPVGGITDLCCHGYSGHVKAYGMATLFILRQHLSNMIKTNYQWSQSLEAKMHREPQSCAACNIIKCLIVNYIATVIFVSMAIWLPTVS